jgi:hypothetical protein
MMCRQARYQVWRAPIRNSVASPEASADAAIGNSGRSAVVSDTQRGVSIAASTGQRAIGACIIEVLTTPPVRRGCSWGRGTRSAMLRDQSLVGDTRFCLIPGPALLER